MNQANIDLNLPSEWLEKITELAVKNNQSTHDFILEILAEHLNINYGNFERKQIRAEVRELRERFNRFEQKDYQFTQLNERLNMLEKLIVSLQSQVLYSKPSTNLSTIDDDEEIYDEPDEILTDFLPD